MNRREEKKRYGLVYARARCCQQRAQSRYRPIWQWLPWMPPRPMYHIGKAIFGSVALAMTTMTKVHPHLWCGFPELTKWHFNNYNLQPHQTKRSVQVFTVKISSSLLLTASWHIARKGNDCCHSHLVNAEGPQLVKLIDFVRKIDLTPVDNGNRSLASLTWNFKVS